MRLSARIAIALLLLAAASPLTAQTQYLAFGDSITEGVGDDATRTEKGYPPRLETLLVNSGRTDTVENRGLGGEKTPDGLERIVLELASLPDADVLLLMEGTNDISRNIGLETTVFNLDSMADLAEDRGMRAVHATVIPRIPNARVDDDNLLNQQMNGLIRNLAFLRGRDLADPFEVFGRQTNSFDRFYSDDPLDRVGHPNGPGYDLLARIFFDLLTGVDNVSPVTGPISPVDGARAVPADSVIDVDVLDFGRGIDLTNTSLLVNGVVVPATVTGNTERIEMRYQPPQPLSGAVTVGLRSRDLATPPNTVDRQIARFVIAGTALLDGDVNEDGRVDGTDLVAFALRFGAVRGERNYKDDADFNNDGRIDGQDLAVLAANFGKSSF